MGGGEVRVDDDDAVCCRDYDGSSAVIVAVEKTAEIIHSIIIYC